MHVDYGMIYELLGSPVKVSIDCATLPICGRLLIVDDHTGAIVIACKGGAEDQQESAAGAYEDRSRPRGSFLQPSLDPGDYILRVIAEHSIVSITRELYS